VEESIYESARTQQVRGRADQGSWYTSARALVDPFGQIRPPCRDEGARSVRKHKQEVWNAVARPAADDFEKLPAEGVAIPGDPHVRWEVVEVGSVS
jgi:hypothetical protein